MFIRMFFFLFLLVFSVDANVDIFTQEEQQWMKEHQEIFYGADPSWVPFDYIDTNGRHQGISQDYLNEVSRISGLKFTLYSNKLWAEVMKDIKAKKVDLLPAVYDSSDRRKYLHYTSSYLKLAEYIFTKKDIPKIKSYKEIDHKSLAVVEGYAVVSWLKEEHPTIKLVLKKNLFECIQALSSGEVFGFIGDIPSSTYLQEKYFITNIKANRIIPDRDPLDLFMAVREDYPLLATIISKSLDEISKESKKNIFEKYSKSHKEEGVRGAFGFGRPPYMYDRTSAKGVEETLVRKALLLEGIKVSEVRQMPIERGQRVLFDNPEIDFSVGVVENKDDGLFYSKKFIKYENFAITRKSEKIKINDIDDLLNHRVLAWDKAYNMLGDEFRELFNPIDKPLNYKEIFDQKLQHKQFFRKEADVILVDKNIFKWYVNQYKNKYEANQEYDFHKVFPKPTWVKVSFRDESLRDSFDKGLEELMESGDYNQIISNFLQVDLQKQLDLSKLMASLSASYIYEKNFKTLKKILDKFNKVEIVKGIEVFSKRDKESVMKLEKSEDGYEKVDQFSWGKSQLSMIEKESYFQEEGNTQHVGKIKVYFDVKDMKEIEISYIPDLNEFQDFNQEDYAYITAVYKRLGLNALTKLSVDEQKWVQEHKVIKFVGDPNWLPYEAFDKKGNYVGIVAEYLEEVEKITGLNFERVQTKTWEESITLIKNKKVDMISETTDSNMREYLHFTQAYLENHIVIVMDSREKYVDKLSQIQDKKIVIIKDYGYVHKIKEAYTKINFIEVDTISEGLKVVSSGRADALLCTMALGSYNISKHGFINLRIVGKTEFSTKIGYGVQPELAPLVGILNKAMLILDEGKKQEILKKWIAQEYVEKVDYTLVWQIIGASLILFALFFYWNRQMKKEIGRRKQAEEELQEVNDQVHKSIEFSSMIQRALIPDIESFDSFFTEHFTIWKPRDTVGGDIYFFETLRHKDEAVLMVVDCTGHGVPGAFVTMLVKAIERNITGYIRKSDEVVSPAKLLGILNRSMKHLLKQHDKSAESNAGFDAGILYINKKEKFLRYAGAEIALYYSKGEEVQMLKGSRQSLGYRTSKADYVFKDYELEYDDGISLYITTDGYVDQNGGLKGFPFGKKKFKQILQDNKNISMLEIEKVLLNELSTYQENYESNDDVTVVGVRL